MTKICRACSTANDPDEAACVTCGEELPSVSPGMPVEHPHEQRPAPAAGFSLLSSTGPATVPDIFPVATPDAHVTPEQTDAPAYVPTFGGSLLDDARHLEGIGGWLLLVALVVIAIPIALGVSMFRNYTPMFLNPDAWSLLQDRPRLHALVVSEAATNVVSFLIGLALVYLFFGKKKMFPALMIFYLVLNALAMAADLVFTYLVVPTTAFRAQDLAAAARSVLLAAILIPYLAVSRRVKVTFVN